MIFEIFYWDFILSIVFYIVEDFLIVVMFVGEDFSFVKLIRDSVGFFVKLKFTVSKL